ncbi:ribokinase [Virgibacillus halophilus]|uniref:Deoxyribokinase n=1 Tax=Tigheibacillus halophilus TaxID=361280 RepID=A0ABU5C272_9BACI|nr:ribokinase [Virgibacillus halophilus]
MDIAVIGSNMVDLITYVDSMPKEGETLEASSFEMGCGGKGANQAVAAAKMGSEVLMLSKVGADMFGDNTIANFKKYEIDTTYVEKVNGIASGVAPIFVDHDSNNRILIVKGANQHLLPADIDRAASKIKQCKLMVLQLEISLETVYHAIDFGRQHGIPVVLNPAPATKDLDFKSVCKCDFFIPNESELEILTGMPVTTKEEVREASLFLVKKGVKQVIVTMGRQGVLWASESTVGHVEAHDVGAVDTTGAGDAFIGCFAHEYVQTGNLKESIKQASAYAAWSVTKRGTQTSYPNRLDFMNWKI